MSALERLDHCHEMFDDGEAICKSPHGGATTSAVRPVRFAPGTLSATIDGTSRICNLSRLGTAPESATSGSGDTSLAIQMFDDTPLAPKLSRSKAGSTQSTNAQSRLSYCARCLAAP